uniref:ER lumen protein-retaining receptor n=1 Tax=Acrobeloides nanus TaxID=290746 RepID=A0A914D658_9BILA
MVFITRYLDLFFSFVSLYNCSFKVIFIMLNMFTLYLILTKYKETYDKDDDKFRIEFLIFLCVTLAMAFNAEFTILEILWTFSIYLEAVAIIPQIYMAYKSGTFDKDVSFYVLMLYSYRSLYIVNWIYRYEVETFYDPIVIV